MFDMKYQFHKINTSNKYWQNNLAQNYLSDAVGNAVVVD